MVMETTHNGMQISDGAKIAEILCTILNTENAIGREREHFWSIGLNAKNEIKYIELVSLGTLTQSLIHPRETYRLAVIHGVASIIVGHNHPSGGIEPSREDRTITERLQQAGDILGIKFLDHIIINESGAYLSMMTNGLMTQSERK
jgi:DNA repair protein RadC